MKIKLSRFLNLPQKGFTLVELLVVIAIIGVLAGATMLSLDPIDKLSVGRDSQVISQTTAILKGMISYYTNNGAWPTTDTQVNGELNATSTTLTAGPYGAYVYGSSGTKAWVCGQVKSKISLSKATGTPTTSNTYYAVTNYNGGCYRTATNNAAACSATDPAC